MKAMQIGGTVKVHVDRAYSNTSQFQWAREAAVNSMQAGATAIRFGTEWQAVAQLGVHRRTIIDNGCGIERHRLLDFFNHFGGSGQTVGTISENFGIGLKIAALPWNPEGIAVVTRGSDGLQSMIVLREFVMNAAGDREYGVIDDWFTIFDLDDATIEAWLSVAPSSVVPLDLFTEFPWNGTDWCRVAPQDQGTTLVLLGSKDHPHSILGDPSRDEVNKYGLVNYLSAKFPLGTDTDIRVQEYKFWSQQDQWPSAPDDTRQGRGSEGIIELLDRMDSIQRGKVEIGGEHPATVHWWLAGESEDGAKPNRRGDRLSFPFSGILWNSHEGINESVEVLHGTKAGGGRLQPFLGTRPVRERLGLFIEPHEDAGMFMDAGRTSMRVTGAGGAEAAPWHMWAEEFGRVLPEEIKQAVNDYYAKTVEGHDALSAEDYQRLAAQYPNLLAKVSRLVPRSDGDTTGPTGAGALGGGRSGGSTPNEPGKTPVPTVRPKPGIDGAAARRMVNGGMIEAEFDPDGSWFADDTKHCAMVYDNTAKRVWVNPEHRFVKDVREAARERYAAHIATAGGDDTLVIAEIDRQIKAQASLAATHQDTLAREIMRAGDSDLADQMMEPVALTIALAGTRSVLDAAAGSIGKLFQGTGAQRKKAS